MLNKLHGLGGRVLCDMAPGKNPLQVELKLLKRVPEEFRLHAHHWLILHGRYVCKARLPECWRCPALAQCNHTAKVLAPPAK